MFGLGLGLGVSNTKGFKDDFHDACKAWAAGTTWDLPETNLWKYDGTPFGKWKWWKPSAMSSAAWFDAADLSSITKVGNNVTQLSDKSGQANHATQGTAGRQPRSGVVALNGLNTISFTQDFLSLTAALSATDGDWSFVGVVITEEASPTSADSILSSNAAATGSFQIDFRNPPNGVGVSITADTGQTDNTHAAGSYIAPYANGAVLMICSTFDASGIKSYLYGALKTEYTTRTCIGARDLPMRFGVNRGGSNYFDHTLCEYIFATSVFSSTDRQKLEGYLAWKWGQVSLLDAGHAYKSEAPRA